MLGQDGNIDSGVSQQIFSSPHFGFGVRCEKSAQEEDQFQEPVWEEWEYF